MDNLKVMILSIKKNEIIYKAKKSYNSIFVFNFLFIVAFTIIFAVSGEMFSGLQVSMSRIYNPVNSLYSDNSGVVFTMVNDKDILDFVVPVRGGTYKINDDGTMVFEILNSIMITACCNGIIEDIGTTNDGIKYIKIKHNENLYSLIENVDIVGVSKNEIVKSGQDIATAKVGKKIYLQIFLKNAKISNVKINQSKITWE